MRKECKMVYTYDELDERAKEKAREWYAGFAFSDSNDWEFVYDDAARMAELIGIDLKTRLVKLMGGGTRYEPNIWFSGFSSQGDGASFEGSYRYKKGAVAAIKKETGFGCELPDGTIATGDKELIRIAQGLQDVQRRHFYRLYAECRSGSLGCASYNMSVEVSDSEDQYRDLGDAEGEIRDLLRDFADWIYSRLEAEYEWQTSDEAVVESIIANEYEFYENGEIL